MNYNRIDSCRNCGKGLQVMDLCKSCQQPLHFECKNCITFVDDPIHYHYNFPSQSFLQQYGVNGK